MKSFFLAAAVGLFGATPLVAGPIEAACLRSDRAPDNPRVCGCIQSVADMMLSGADQRTAAGFFTNPERAQKVRQSGSRSNLVFWERYTAFGESAEAMCAL